jgi:anaerobic selenocysteine-containing dehydrogenase
VQFRPAAVAPRGEARADIDIVFDLAVRLGLGDHFWHGDIEAALDYRLAPSGLSLQKLRANPRGVRVPLKTAYQKYRDAGFATPSGKIEIFSTMLPAVGQPPLPEFRAPFAKIDGFPLTLTTVKTPLYCHSQHRNLAQLRRLEPDPVARAQPRDRRFPRYWPGRLAGDHHTTWKGTGAGAAQCDIGRWYHRGPARLVASLLRSGSTRL